MADQYVKQVVQVVIICVGLVLKSENIIGVSDPTKLHVHHTHHDV